MAPRSDPLRPAGHPQSTDSIQTQPGLLHPSQLSPSMHSVSSTPTPPADPPPLCTLPPLHASGWDFPRARGQGSVCGWRAGEEHFPALETKRKTERGTERCRLIITAVLPPEKEVARTWPSATQGRRGARTPRALLPFPHCGALRCHEASIRGEELCPPAPQKPPAWGCSPRLPPDRNVRTGSVGLGLGVRLGRAGGGSAPRLSATGGILGLPQGWGDVFFPLGELRLFPSFRIRVGPWKHSKAGHGGGGGMAALGPDSSARPLPESAPPGAEAPAGTRCSAPHPPSGSRRCKSQAKVLGGKEGRGPAHAAFQAAHPSGTHRCLPGVGGT